MENKDTIDTIIEKYGQPIPKRPRKGRIIFASIVILVVITVVIIGIFVLLKNNVQMPAAAPAVTQAANGPSASAITDKIAANPIIAGATSYFVARVDPTQQITDTNTSSVIYRKDGYDYLATITAEDGLNFTLTSTKATSNEAAITAAIQSTLTAEGFTQTAQDTSSLSPYPVTSYVNGGTICQIIDYVTSKQKTLEQGVLCETNSGLGVGYKNIQTLLDKASSTATKDAAAIYQSTTTDGTKHLLTVVVTPHGSASPTTYYFATTSKDYEYIGNRPAPSIDNEASYTLSDQLKKNIADPKWGTFLSDNIK